ncbi:transcription factor bHLH112-like protein [Gossypium australe]|uniref:Transcription factor bHLH112-like protein n=1 Tax=Gossypium australe TaxID=47621 RepID=A0A5B6UJ26_9ROSI|nr:transcription factor bHLH112-like protein [Gossypium australe]
MNARRNHRGNIVDDKEEKDITVEVGDNQNNQQLPAAFAPQTMYDYAKPTLIGAESSIVRPTIAVNNFELKPNTI